MLKKAVLIALVIVTYFFAVRPAREYYTTHLVSPEVKEWIVNSSKIKSSSVVFTPKTDKSFFLSFTVGDAQKDMIYSPQAGLFLLLAAVGLICITLKWQYYLILLALHLAFEGIVIFALWIGISYSTIGLIFVDFIISYLSPIMSLGIIPTLLLYRKEGIG